VKPGSAARRTFVARRAFITHGALVARCRIIARGANVALVTLVTLAAACSNRPEANAQTQPPEPAPRPGHDAGSPGDAASRRSAAGMTEAASTPSSTGMTEAASTPSSTGMTEAASTPNPTGTTVIPATARQLITGITADWTSTTVMLRRWHRRDGMWIADGAHWQGVIGKTGAAWGSGLHGDGAPPGSGGPVKREGDGKAPAGAFAIRGVYGYAAGPPPKTVLPYRQTTADWQCVDDPASSHYTRIVDRKTLAVDWTSAEQMRRRDELYTWVIDIAHNRAATPGGGSCIFFHVWRGPRSFTVGCTAMPEPKLAALISGLDATAVYVLLPRAEYDTFAAPWGLPRDEK
jgi:D-alanyl-D-alanine dipeptidase